MIKTEHFTKKYSSRTACSDISLTARDNEITVLLGPNGAGKTTLLRALAGFHYPTDGSVSLPSAAKIGFVGETPFLYAEYTVREFLSMAASLRLPSAGKEDRDSAISRTVELCSLSSVLNQKISTLSHGYRQRVNFAQALIHDPDILILDEPATGLDPRQIHEMRTLVKKLKAGRTIIFSTHIIQEAENLSDNIYIINRGRLVAQGSPKELLAESKCRNLEDAYLTLIDSSESASENISGTVTEPCDKCGAESVSAVKVSARKKHFFSGFLPLLKHELYSCAINPFYYAAAILFSVFAAAGFFFGSQFFVREKGSTNLSPFFLLMPYISSLLIPALCLNIKSRAFDSSLNFSQFTKNTARIISALIVFALYLVPTILVPVSVSAFGDTEAGAVITAYSGILLFGLAAISLCVFLSTVFGSNNRAAFFVTSVLLLAAVNSVYNIPLVVPLSDFAVSLIHKVSFAWHFDSASKGILDTRDLFYYLILAFAFLALGVFVFERKRGMIFFSGKNPRLALNSFTLVLIFLFAALDSSRFYKRFDFSKGSSYSASAYTNSLIKSTDEKIRITYYRSSELLNLYPQIRDVGDFLESLSLQNRNITFTQLEPAKAKSETLLQELGVQPFQIQNVKGNSLEYINTYSAVVLEYMDKTMVLPAAFSTVSLEYDLDVRLEWLINKKSRSCYVFCGNDFSLEKDYKTCLQWLNIEGFETRSLDFDSPEALSDIGIPLLLFGTKNLSPQNSALIKTFIDRGGAVIVMTSPFSIDVNGSWKVSENSRDNFIPVLKEYGFSFEDSLAADISNVRASFYSAPPSNSYGQESSVRAPEYKYVNYPLWISVLPQENAVQGVNVFWASPIRFDSSKVKGILSSSRAGWAFLPDRENPDILFDTNPFSVPKTAPDDNRIKKGPSVLAASSGRVLVISGDLFVSDLLLSLAGGETGDYRNLDFITASILNLTGQNDLAKLKASGFTDRSLYKITDSNTFARQRQNALSVNFIFVPAAILLAMTFFFIRRRKTMSGTFEL